MYTCMYIHMRNYQWQTERLKLKGFVVSDCWACRGHHPLCRVASLSPSSGRRKSMRLSVGWRLDLYGLFHGELRLSSLLVLAYTYTYVDIYICINRCIYIYKYLYIHTQTVQTHLHTYTYTHISQIASHLHMNQHTHTNKQQTTETTKY